VQVRPSPCPPGPPGPPCPLVSFISLLAEGSNLWCVSITPGSKDVLQIWHPQSKLNMDVEKHRIKPKERGGIKDVYDTDTMKMTKHFLKVRFNGDFLPLRFFIECKSVRETYE